MSESEPQPTFTLKVTIGPSSFDGTGPKADVNAAYLAWIEAMKVTVAARPIPKKSEDRGGDADGEKGGGEGGDVDDDRDDSHVGGRRVDEAIMRRVFKNEHDGPVSLLMQPKTNEECLLLILLGYSLLRNETNVGTVQIGAALAKTGRTIRVDRVMSRMSNMVGASGTSKGKRYSLKNPGEEAAFKILANILN